MVADNELTLVLTLQLSTLMPKSKHMILLMVISILGCAQVSAKYRPRAYYDHSNFFTVSGGIGYATLLEDFPELTTTGGVGLTLGFSYELRKTGFWLNVGPEFQYMMTVAHYNISGLDKRIYDTQGKQVVYHYDFDATHDVQDIVSLNVPILLGYWNHAFYVGAGLKLGTCVYAAETSTLAYTTSGSYDRYIAVFEQMSNHYYSNYRLSETQKLNAKFKASVIAEIGYDIMAWAREANHTEHHGLKIGAYMEIGLNNIIRTTQERPLFQIDEANVSYLHLTTFYNANATVSHSVIPLSAGMKISWTFCIRTKNCGCNIGENHRNFYNRYKRVIR